MESAGKRFQLSHSFDEEEAEISRSLGLYQRYWATLTHFNWVWSRRSSFPSATAIAAQFWFLPPTREAMSFSEPAGASGNNSADANGATASPSSSSTGVRARAAFWATESGGGGCPDCEVIIVLVDRPERRSTSFGRESAVCCLTALWEPSCYRRPSARRWPVV